MPYRFRRKETAANGVRRIAREQTAAVISLLADRGNNVAGRIHEARRHIKRLRALVKLIKPAADEKAAESQDDVLRNTSKRLSRSRDAEVCLATFEKLIRKESDPALEGIRTLLREATDRAHRTAATPAQLSTIAAIIREAGHKIAEIPFIAEDWLLIESGLENSYRESRKMRKLLRKKSGEKEFHEWRKLVKRLFHQLELVRQTLGKGQSKVLRKLEKLGDQLGDFHDLDVLESRLRDLAAHGIGRGDAASVEKLACKQRKHLKRSIGKLAKAAFEDRPRRFARKTREAWKQARKTQP